MKKVLFATENESKVNRFKDKLLKHNIEVLSIDDIDKKLNKYFTDIPKEEKENLTEDENDVIEFLCKDI